MLLHNPKAILVTARKVKVGEAIYGMAIASLSKPDWVGQMVVTSPVTKTKHAPNGLGFFTNLHYVLTTNGSPYFVIEGDY